jgi:DNA polymerase III epsilon subunit-like protein
MTTRSKKRFQAEHELKTEELVIAELNAFTQSSHQPVIPIYERIPTNMNLLVIDTETTGLPIDRHAPVSVRGNWPFPVQIAWCIFRPPNLAIPESPKGIQLERSFIIYPDGWTIPEDSTKIHGISQIHAMESGEPLRKVLQKLHEDCHSVNGIVFHNRDFDLPVLLHAETLVGMPYSMSPLKSLPCLCTMMYGRNLCKLPMPSSLSEMKEGISSKKYKAPRLEELYMFLYKKSPTRRLHNALEDVRVLADCLTQLFTFHVSSLRVEAPLLFRSVTEVDASASSSSKVARRRE